MVHYDTLEHLFSHVNEPSFVILISSYITFATLLHLLECQAKEQDTIIWAVRTWLQTHCGWLLILDNADELTLLLDFLPPSLGGHLLLTTRASATGRLAHRLEIETLEPVQSALFLLRRAAFLSPDVPLEQAPSQERELALQISQELGGLPLALDQAGAYLEETGTGLAEYRHLYQQHRADLLRERRGLVADHPSPVATTWLLSFQKVKEKNSAAADLLQLCAYLAPDAIPEEVLITGAVFLGSALAPIATNALLFHQAVEALRAYSLVQRDSRQKLLSVHRLVQAVLCDTLPAETHRQWVQRAIRAVSAVFPSGEFKTWPACERLLPHALVCIDWIKQEYIETSETARLLQQVGYYLTERGHYPQAEPLCQRALAIRDRVLGSEHSDITFSLNNLAFIYRKQGKYTEAASLCQRALAICEQVLGLDHPETAGSLNNLADLYCNQEKHAEAEPLYQRALAIYERTLGPEDLDTATILWGLADLYGRQGKDVEAEPLYQRAVHIREQVAGHEHPDTAEVLYSFALFREAQGNKDEARSLYIRALAIREKALGTDHRKTMETRQSLMVLLQTMGQHEEATMLEAAQPGTSKPENEHARVQEP